MNATLFCVRCKHAARFICERCSDPYCSKTCQIMHWPLHRYMCFPMPSLLEISNETNMVSMWDTHNSENLAHLYKYNSYSQNQSRYGPIIDYNQSNNNRRLIRSEHLRQEQSYSDDQTVDWRKEKSVLETQRCQLSNSQKWNKPSNPTKTELPTTSDTQNSDKIINLAVTKEYVPLPKASLNWDEEITDPINELKELMSNESRNWKNAFSFKNDTLVTIVHFAESPTTSCWVVQNQYAPKTRYLQDATKRLHGIVDCTKIIKYNEVYSVRYEDIYYRAVCVYEINSREVLVRLIDVGLTIQVQISALKDLDPRLKTINAFAFEINFEMSMDVNIGQTIRINSFAADATGTINVKLGVEQRDNVINIVPLPMGVPMELFCLDHSNIKKGYISACIHDPKKIESIDNLSDKIKNYLNNLANAGKYCPILDEICFAYHETECQWYRAECIREIDADNFEVILIDYGSTRTVNSSNIREFVSEFTEPKAIMHFCLMEGIPQRPGNNLIKKIVGFFNANPIFSIADAKYDDGMVIINCPDLLSAI